MKRKLLVILIILLSIPALAYAEEAVDVTITGYYDYTSAYEVLDIVNAERQKAGLHPLMMNETLLEAAMQRAAEIYLVYQSTHQRPDDSSCFTVINGFDYRMAGENIAARQRDSAYVMNAWMNSPGHRENILREGYNTIGVGCFYQEEVGFRTWVQIFTANPYGGYVTTGEEERKVNIKILPKHLEKTVAYNPSIIDYSGFSYYTYICPGKTEEFKLVTLNTVASLIDTECYNFVATSDNISIDGRNITVLSEGEASFDFYIGGKYIGSHSFTVEHDFVDAGNPPTCNEPGYTGGTCKDCNYSEEKTMIPPLGHNQIIKEGYEPTCINSGRTDALYCDRCGEYLSTPDLIPAKGHDYEKNEIIPTCEEWGYDEYACKDCDYVEIDRESYIRPTGHDYGEWKINEETMDQISVCENCGDIKIGSSLITLLDDGIYELIGENLTHWDESAIMTLKGMYDTLSESQRAALEYEEELLGMIRVFDFYHMGDIDLDGKIDTTDLSELLDEYSYTYSDSDIAGGDNVVNSDDLSMLLSCYGQER